MCLVKAIPLGAQQLISAVVGYFIWSYALSYLDGATCRWTVRWTKWFPWHWHHLNMSKTALPMTLQGWMVVMLFHVALESPHNYSKFVNLLELMSILKGEIEVKLSQVWVVSCVGMVLWAERGGWSRISPPGLFIHVWQSPYLSEVFILQLWQVKGYYWQPSRSTITECTNCHSRETAWSAHSFSVWPPESWPFKQTRSSACPPGWRPT